MHEWSACAGEIPLGEDACDQPDFGAMDGHAPSLLILPTSTKYLLAVGHYLAQEFPNFLSRHGWGEVFLFSIAVSESAGMLALGLRKSHNSTSVARIKSGTHLERNNRVLAVPGGTGACHEAFKNYTAVRIGSELCLIEPDS
jgi:hypothetical protein